MTIKPINWNAIEDEVDKEVWDKLTSNFWLPEKIPLSGDISQWKKMTKQEQDTLARVFAGLTLLDTVQGTLGATSMIPDSITTHEEAVLSYITFNEAVHAKSYSTIFSTLLTTPEINEAFDWSEENKFLQYKADKIVSFYNEDDPVKKKIASVILESFLFYSGFYYIFHLASRGLLINSANIIQLILRDECVSSDNQVFTNRGWIYADQITLNDQLLQYDMYSGKYSFTLPLAITSTNVSEIYSVHTPEHYPYYCSRNHRILGTSGETTAGQFNNTDLNSLGMIPEESSCLPVSIMSVTSIHYPTVVYGFETPNGTIVIRGDHRDSGIITGNSVHGYYLGYKSQKLQEIGQYTKEMRESYADFAYDLVFDLMENEFKYTHELYDELGLYSEVESFLKYNANKALMNLGYGAIYPKDESTPPPEIMASLDPTSNANHDFFSSSGSSYVVVGSEETTDDDWDF